jgi:hypothetical protein
LPLPPVNMIRFGMALSRIVGMSRST